jgi:hypothetical protein
VRASVRRGLHRQQHELAALEANATRVRHFLPTLITGLLQIPEYIRAAPCVLPLNRPQATLARRWQPADVIAAAGYTQAVCGNRVLAEDHTLARSKSAALCMAYIIGAASDVPDASRRCTS